MTDIKKAVMEKLAAASPDCGDNSCAFAVNKGGMRTSRLSAVKLHRSSEHA